VAPSTPSTPGISLDRFRFSVQSRNLRRMQRSGRIIAWKVDFECFYSGDLISVGVPVSTQLQHHDATDLVKIIERFLETR